MIFRSLQPKRKFTLLVVVIVVILIVSYKRSFSITWNAYATYKNVKFNKAPQSETVLQDLKTKLAHIESILGNDGNAPRSIQQKILETYGYWKPKTELMRIEPMHVAGNDYYIVYTNTLVLNGRYRDLLHIAYRFEREFKFSRVVSTSFIVDQARGRGNKKLALKIIFQNYEKMG